MKQRQTYNSRLIIYKCLKRESESEKKSLLHVSCRKSQRTFVFAHSDNLLSKEKFLLLCMTSTFLKLLIMITFTNFFNVEIFPEAERYLELFFRNNDI